MGPGSGGYTLYGGRFRYDFLELTVQRSESKTQAGLAYQFIFFEEGIASLHLNLGFLVPVYLHPGIGFRMGVPIGGFQFGIRIDQYVQIKGHGKGLGQMTPMTILGVFFQI